MSSETSSFEKIVPTTSSTNTPLQSEEETNIIDGFDFSEAEQVNTKNLAIIPEEKEEIPTSKKLIKNIGNLLVVNMMMILLLKQVN